jgi:hypothetical protein
VKPSLYLVKRDMGRSMDSRKTEVLFVVVDSDISRAYPANFVCVLPLTQGLCGNSIFSKMFGDDSLSVARRLLSKALLKESDSEFKTAISKRLKLLDPKIVVKARCKVCKSLFEPKNFRGHYQKTCQNCKSKMIINAG